MTGSRVAGLPNPSHQPGEASPDNHGPRLVFYLLTRAAVKTVRPRALRALRIDRVPCSVMPKTGRRQQKTTLTEPRPFRNDILLVTEVRRRVVSRVEQFAAIRRDHRVDGLSIRALADKHGVHLRTVRQALESAVPPPVERLLR